MTFHDHSDEPQTGPEPDTDTEPDTDDEQTDDEQPGNVPSSVTDLPEGAEVDPLTDARPQPVEEAEPDDGQQ